MMRTSEHDKRTFIKVIVSTVLITISLSGILLRGANPMVMAQSVDDYVGPNTCQMCHAENYDEWDGTRHSNAFKDEAFQSDWQSQGSPSECLECHTTGYDSASGEYAFEGVTCESCHGAGLTMAIDTSSELCGSCHTGEYGKDKFVLFQEGIHSSSGVKCIDCHMHEDNHRFEVESKACATCHTDDDIHDRKLILDLQEVNIEAEEKIDQLEAEYNELLSSIDQEQDRTTLMTYVAYSGAGIIIILSVIVAIYYYRYKGA
jgi:hypothetical protein